MDSIYGNHRPEMEAVLNKVEAAVEQVRDDLKEEYGTDPVEHVRTRIKGEDSMREKCRRKGIPETAESALQVLTDAIGVRVVCNFVNDVYVVRDRLIDNTGFEIIEEEDYIKHAKPNGYRSYHLNLRVDGYYVEVQIRTISQDTWAALEHTLKYKKEIGGNAELIAAELKRCADELAGADMSMQTLREMIYKL